MTEPVSGSERSEVPDTGRVKQMEQTQVPYQRIVFVCINRRTAPEACCAERDSEAIAERLKARVKELGLSRLVRVSKSGCQDVCAKGPNVMVFPDYAWYHGVTIEDVERFMSGRGAAGAGR